MSEEEATYNEKEGEPLSKTKKWFLGLWSKKKRADTIKNIIAIALLLGLLTWTGALFWSSPSGSSQASIQKQEDSIAAYTYEQIKSAIKKVAPSASTISFCPFGEVERSKNQRLKSIDIWGDRWVGWLDSQNSNGAMTRYDWKVTVLSKPHYDLDSKKAVGSINLSPIQLKSR